VNLMRVVDLGCHNHPAFVDPEKIRRRGHETTFAALFLACPPRRSYLAVVVTLACPTKCCTTEMSTPASRRSDTHDRRKSWGEKARTSAMA